MTDHEQQVTNNLSMAIAREVLITDEPWKVVVAYRAMIDASKYFK